MLRKADLEVSFWLAGFTRDETAPSETWYAPSCAYGVTRDEDDGRGWFAIGFDPDAEDVKPLAATGELLGWHERPAFYPTKELAFAAIAPATRELAEKRAADWEAGERLRDPFRRYAGAKAYAVRQLPSRVPGPELALLPPDPVPVYYPAPGTRVEAWDTMSWQLGVAVSASSDEDGNRIPTGYVAVLVGNGQGTWGFYPGAVRPAPR